MIKTTEQIKAAAMIVADIEQLESFLAKTKNDFFFFTTTMDIDEAISRIDNVGIRIKIESNCQMLAKDMSYMIVEKIKTEIQNLRMKLLEMGVES